MMMGELGGRLGRPRRVAVVGSGISGLSAAWLLAPEAHVTLFESAARAGGHTNTVDVSLEGLVHPVDTGFLVFNRRTYPNLCALFEVLGVSSVETEMSFSVSLAECGLEWAGNSLDTVFAQRRNLLSPAMWRMLADILRFNREATRIAQSSDEAAEALGNYLARRRYGAAFRDWYLLPMAAAIWSCPTRAMLAYPVGAFARFCHNHGLLQVVDRPRWMTVRNGARSYVERMLDRLEDVRLATPVERVMRDDEGVLVAAGGRLERFDDVVLACHSDQCLALLGSAASAKERSVLGAIRYQRNRAVLHSDATLLPRSRKVWSAWNYIAGQGEPGARPVAVSYLINKLQPLPFETPLVVSLNPFSEPAADKRIAEFDYAHPVFDEAAVAAQARLSELQGEGGIWYAGAWAGYGFHEDGLKAGMAVARRLGASIPWRDSVREDANGTSSDPADGRDMHVASTAPAAHRRRIDTRVVS